MAFNADKAEKAYKQIIEAAGEDPEREGVQETPLRCARALEALTMGYRLKIEDVAGSAIFPEGDPSMVIVRDIEFFSMCEHHLLPFFGRCHIGYLPNGKVLGLSKFARITDMFARRFQIQERLCKEIAAAVQELLQPLGVAVVIEARHMCMSMRGVEKHSASTTTSHMLGEFRNNSKTRQEFLTLLLSKSHL